MRIIRQALLGLFITAISILISLILVEVGIRLLGSRMKQGVAWNDRPPFYYKPQDSPTMQDFPFSKEKSEGTYRVAVLGDSFTFATQMQFDDAFPKKLERMLNLNSEARRVEVINYGVPGYSTYHEAADLKGIMTHRPDMVLLQITLNDTQIKSYTPKGITGRNEFGELILSGREKKIAQYWHTYGFIVRRIHNTKTHKRYERYYFSLFENRHKWRRFRQAIEQMERRTRRREVPFAAVVFPLFGHPIDHLYPFEPIHQKVLDLLEELNIPALDLLETYRGIPLERIQLIPGQDFHPNEIGHRMAAEAIYNWLEEIDLLPEEFQIKDRYINRLSILPEQNTPIR